MGAGPFLNLYRFETIGSVEIWPLIWRGLAGGFGEVERDCRKVLLPTSGDSESEAPFVAGCLE